jgi:hypothetical protein
MKQMFKKLKKAINGLFQLFLRAVSDGVLDPKLTHFTEEAWFRVGISVLKTGGI